MVRSYFLATFLLINLVGKAQTLWTGPPMLFSKPNFADWTLPQNQDRITDSIWLTRGDLRGIFNIRKETEYDKSNNTSPAGTRWARGTIADGIQNLSFGSWSQSNNGSPSHELHVNKVLHLIAEDIYIDIRFTSWTQGGGGSGTSFGGGMTYVRSTDPNVGFTELTDQALSLYPNPAHSTLRVSGLQQPEEYSISDMLGVPMLSGIINPESEIFLARLNPGIYILQVEDQRIPFVLE